MNAFKAQNYQKILSACRITEDGMEIATCDRDNRRGTLYGDFERSHKTSME